MRIPIGTGEARRRALLGKLRLVEEDAESLLLEAEGGHFEDDSLESVTFDGKEYIIEMVRVEPAFLSVYSVRPGGDEHALVSYAPTT